MFSGPVWSKYEPGKACSDSKGRPGRSFLCSNSMTNYSLGLTGYPLGHSLSPRIHAAALQAAGLQGQYKLYPVSPDDLAALAALIERVRSGELDGLNVTIPHKQAVMGLIDGCSETAQRIGAVNTIYRLDCKVMGDNTDAPGFLSDLIRFFEREQFHASGKRHALVLGAGGSARAVVYALLNDGWHVTIAARRPQQAAALAADLGVGHQAEGRSTVDLAALSKDGVDLLVNTTPIGMYPAVEDNPWPQGLELPAQAAIYDLIYNPVEKGLVNLARQAGLPAQNGLGMLIEQAALAFERWTGQNGSRHAMLEAAGASF